ncbi:hypothetical protein B0H13DRAFT_1083770 [Mycena leptocephala]|nr:hypothetical protein B0H13DRAFT_1083770 [Mycena leptocephala]
MGIALRHCNWGTLHRALRPIRPPSPLSSPVPRPSTYSYLEGVYSDDDEGAGLRSVRVDTNLKGYGSTSIRVVDISITPLHIGARTRASAYALGEFETDIVLFCKTGIEVNRTDSSAWKKSHIYIVHSKFSYLVFRPKLAFYAPIFIH